jgi:hypothetical protein
MSSKDDDPFVNRDTPIPVVSITSPQDQSVPRTPSNQDASQHHLSATKLKEKLGSLGDSGKQESSSRVSDKLFSM